MPGSLPYPVSSLEQVGKPISCTCSGSSTQVPCIRVIKHSICKTGVKERQQSSGLATNLGVPLVRSWVRTSLSAAWLAGVDFAEAAVFIHLRCKCCTQPNNPSIRSTLTRCDDSDWKPTTPSQCEALFSSKFDPPVSLKFSSPWQASIECCTTSRPFLPFAFAQIADFTSVWACGEVQNPAGWLPNSSSPNHRNYPVHDSTTCFHQKY